MQIKTEARQSIVDAAIQAYGNVDALKTLLEDNAATLLNQGDFNNDFEAPDPALVELDLAQMLMAGRSLAVRDDATITNKAVLRELTGRTITTYPIP